jgi:hypothetical protein
LSAWVLPVWNVASWSAVRCIVRCVVSVVNVFRSGSSSEGHHSKRTLHHSVYLSARLKLRGTNSTNFSKELCSGDLGTDEGFAEIITLWSCSHYHNVLFSFNVDWGSILGSKNFLLATVFRLAPEPFQPLTQW